MARVKLTDPVTGDDDGDDAQDPVAPTTIAITAKEPAPATTEPPARAVDENGEPEPTLAEIEALEKRIAAWRAKHTPAKVLPPAGVVQRDFKVSLPHNKPLVVTVEGPAESNWHTLAVAAYNNARGILSTKQTHTVEDHHAEPAPVPAA